MIATNDDFATVVVNVRAATGSVLPARPVTDIAFDPAVPGTMYITYSGFNQATPAQPGHVFKITNLFGASPKATRISTPVNIPHNTIAVDPNSPEIIYVGTDIGVWRTANGGSSWQHMGPNNTGLPNVAVFDIKIAGEKLVAFTHGRGAFESATFDLNGDGSVGCADLNVVKTSYGRRNGQAGFSALADLTNDQQVDIRDLTLMSQQLPPGVTCP